MQESVPPNQGIPATPSTREEFLRLATHNCTEPKEFLREINIYNDRYYNDGEWIFRGHFNADWELIPSVFRDNQVLSVAELMLQIYRDKNRNDATSKELSKRGEAFNFILARVCAAVEHDRVNSFVIGLDNADIGIPYHSNFHRPDYSPEDAITFGQHDFGSRVAQRSNFRKDWLTREIREIVRTYKNLPRHQEIGRGSFAHGMYQRLEQRYLDISFALAQHSGLPTGLLDWTTDPLVSAFYAAYDRAKTGRQFEKIAVWAVDSSFFERNLPQTKFIKHPRSYIRNIHAQSAVFTRDAEDWRNCVSNTMKPNFESYLSMFMRPSHDRQSVWRITLPFHRRYELLSLLKKSNISLSTLEPTHYHVADDVMHDFMDKHDTE